MEDETLVAMLVEDTLLDAGARVIGPVATVAEALALVARGVPFVVASGYGASGVPARHTGVPVLAKPYAPEELTAMLVRLAG